MRALVVPVVLLLAVSNAPGQEKSRLDAHGDPLPSGAVFRLGSTRFRHGGTPTSVAFLDAKTLISAGGDGALRVWEVPSGRQLREVRGLGYSPSALTTDGRLALSVDREGYYAAWDVRTGKLLRKFGVGYYTRGLGLYRDRVYCATQEEISVWDMDGPKPIRLLVRDRNDVNGLALSGDGSIVAAALGPTIRLWEAATGKEVRDLRCTEETGPFLLVFAPGKPRLLASTHLGNTARIWDLETGKVLHEFRPKWANGLAFSPDGKLLALGGKWDEDGIVLYDVASGKLVRRIAGGPRYQAAQGLAFSPDGKYIAASGIDSVVQVFEVATGKPMHPTDQPQAGVRDMVLSPDGKSLVVGGNGLEVTVWDVTTGRQRGTVPAEKSGLPAGFGKDGRILLGRIGSFEGTFYWHDVITGKDERLFRVPHPIHTLALTQDRPTLVILTTTNGNLSLWDLAGKKEIASPERPQEAESYYGLAVSPDGKRLATSGVVRSVATGELVRILKPGHWTTVNGAAFSPDGKHVATVSSRSVLIYDATDGLPPRELPLPRESGWAVAYHPGGKWLAVGERDGVALHDVATGKVVHRFTGHRGIVRQMAFTPDGKRLLSGGDDASVIVWDLENVGK